MGLSVSDPVGAHYRQASLPLEERPAPAGGQPD